MRGSTIQFSNIWFWPTALCNFLCSDVSWWKADGCPGGTWLSKHQSLCLNFIVSPPTKLDSRPAFTIFRTAIYVHVEIPFLCLVVSRRGTLFFEISASCSFCLGRYVFIEFVEGFVKPKMSLIFTVGIYTDSFIPILTWTKLCFRCILTIHETLCNWLEHGFLTEEVIPDMPTVICKIWPILHPL